MRLAVVILCCLALILIRSGTSAATDAFVGVVKALEGGAVITRNGETITVGTGMEIQRADYVKTDRRGYVGLVFSDDTRISIGPNTEIAIDDYLFDPLEKKLSFVLRLIQGTLSFISGQIAKLSPDSVQLVMPVATIGVRGTHLLIEADGCARNPRSCYSRGGGDR
jgi:hypothetical protein